MQAVQSISLKSFQMERPVNKTLLYDVIIIGSGLAGMSCALQLSEHLKIAVISKGALIGGSSDWAQGGIAAVMDTQDTFAAHVADTVVAGADLGDLSAIETIISRAPAAIHWLESQGVAFSREHNELHLTREGGHSHRRVVHADDATGHAIQTTLAKQLASRSNITLLTNVIAVELMTDKHTRGNTHHDQNTQCYGVYVQHKDSGEIQALPALNTVLATGGAGKVYKVTTNPDGNSGDGIAMGWRAGCRVANMEFMQFHPTCLYHPHAKSFLISEALRGEGGILRLPAAAGQPANSGYRFMFDHDERGELAPRDIVARAIDFEMKKNGLDCVHLDMTHLPPEFLHEHFPNISAKCASLGIDIATAPIPVAPGAHYTCGGLVTDEDGRTDVNHLYAIGEVAYTGLHGANRLASNSLLECVVMGQATAKHINANAHDWREGAAADILEWDASKVIPADERVLISHSWDALRNVMWNYVGIVRSNKRLDFAQKRLDMLHQEINDYYTHYIITPDLVEMRNLLTCAQLIVDSARARHESRGLHYSLDYPRILPKAMVTVLVPK